MRAARVDQLEIVGLEACRRAGLAVVEELIDVLRRDRVELLLPPEGTMGWDRAAFLNLAFWTVGGGELLPSRIVAADQLAHVAWHWVCRRRLGRGVDAMLLGEAVASAFDVYLVGGLLRGGGRAAFLEEVVPRMSERAADAGMGRRAFERMLRGWAADPAAAMERLRALLYDVARKAWRVRDVRRAAAVMASFDGQELAPLIHHYEVANWILAARAVAAKAGPGGGRKAKGLDARLRRAADPMRVLREML